MLVVSSVSDRLVNKIVKKKKKGGGHHHEQKKLTPGCQNLFSYDEKGKLIPHNIFVRFLRGVECHSVE